MHRYFVSILRIFPLFCLRSFFSFLLLLDSFWIKFHRFYLELGWMYLWMSNSNFFSFFRFGFNEVPAKVKPFINQSFWMCVSSFFRFIQFTFLFVYIFISKTCTVHIQEMNNKTHCTKVHLGTKSEQKLNEAIAYIRYIMLKDERSKEN